MADLTGTRQRAHIVWDWNGTLLHDTDAVVAASNASFAALGVAPLTLERYRDLYTLPLATFQERLIGRAPTAAERRLLDETFATQYAALAGGTALAEGAARLLADWEAEGHTQSLCSLAGHDILGGLLRRYGIDRHFLRVDGSVAGQPLTSKAAQMARHLAALDGVSPADVVVIGDATDDAVAAAHAGARAVLYTGGTHSRRSLMTAGVPVVDSLAEAVRTAREMTARPVGRTL
ncbi:HAD family hydrolase [Streptomyces sp. RFCAC02]|uniref:HAD family hydrolase n=1 Tax=Streptomyces sp. RFCAC02 TaxID=2499143 RepID=UPI00101FAB00|nr:HAD family hydrolase [Streptomyces sp. RFCAC02]